MMCKWKRRNFNLSGVAILTIFVIATLSKKYSFTASSNDVAVIEKEDVVVVHHKSSRSTASWGGMKDPINSTWRERWTKRPSLDKEYPSRLTYGEVGKLTLMLP